MSMQAHTSLHLWHPGRLLHLRHSALLDQAGARGGLVLYWSSSLGKCTYRIRIPS
jgi:hypothetical protein